MKQLIKPVVIVMLIIVLLFAILAGGIHWHKAYQEHLYNTSYSTRAWDYLYLEPRYYAIGYVAQAEHSGAEETLSVDVYAATDQYGIPADGGVFIHIASDDFTHTTDCAQIIYEGKDGYEASDFAWDAFFEEYAEDERMFHMTGLPFHFQLNLTPMKKLDSAEDGTVLVVVIPFGKASDPAGLQGKELEDWVEVQLAQGYPNGIEIPYYFDGEQYHWGERVIEQVKAEE